MFRLRDKNTKQIVEFGFQELLDELNRDRSEDWSEYTMYSNLLEIAEGIDHFTEYERSMK